MIRRAIAVVVLVTACSDLELTSRGTCGNDILEEGEDCDGTDGCDDACTIKCAVLDDSPVVGTDTDTGLCEEYPGYVCGADGRCHAPSGRLDFGAILPFSAAEAHVTFLDPDAYPDILDVGSTSLVVHYGASEIRTESTRTPTIQGPVAITNLGTTGASEPRFDRSFEVLVPTIDGMVMYSSRFGRLAAEPFPADSTGDPDRTLAMVEIVPTGTTDENAHRRVGLFSEDETTFQLVFKPADVTEGQLPGQPEHPVCGATGADFQANHFDSYGFDLNGQGQMVFVVGIGGAPFQLCAFAMVDKPGSSPEFTYQALTLPTIPPQDVRPVLANVSGDACPELVVRDEGGLTTILSGRFALTHCTFPAAGERAVLAFDPAVGRLQSPAKPLDDLVLSTGIYRPTTVTTSTYLKEIYHADRTLARALGADFNHDGELDAVLTGDNVNDLDLLLGTRSAALEGFLRIRLPTAGAVTAIATGDFDGNGFTDLIHGERFLEFERLSVSYGTSDRLLDPVPVANFSSLISLVIGQLQDHSDPTGVLGDVGVLDQGTGTKPRLTVLRGSAERTMIPLFAPPRSRDGFQSVVAGSLDDDGQLDLFAVNGGGELMFRFFGEFGGLRFDDSAIQAPVYNCGGGVCDGGSGARQLVRPQSVLSVDTSGRIITFDPTPTSCDPDSHRCVPRAVSEAKSLRTLTTAPVPFEIRPHAPRVFDLDSDGVDELLLAYVTEIGGYGGLSEGDVLVCDNELTACASTNESVAQVDPAFTRCADAAPGVLAPGGRGQSPPARELFAICSTADGRTSLFRLRLEADALSAEHAMELFLFEPPRSLSIADATGDGIDDVVIVTDGFDQRSLWIMRQLTSREAAMSPPKDGEVVSGGAPPEPR